MGALFKVVPGVRMPPSEFSESLCEVRITYAYHIFRIKKGGSPNSFSGKLPPLTPAVVQNAEKRLFQTGQKINDLFVSKKLSFCTFSRLALAVCTGWEKIQNINIF